MADKNLDLSVFDEALSEYANENVDLDEFDKTVNEYDGEEATAAIAGFGQGASFGTTDELTGAGGSLYETLTQKPLLDESKYDQMLRAYEEHRDLARKRQAELQEKSPTAYGVSEFAGGITAPVPFASGIKIAKGASPLLNLAKTVGAGAAVGTGVGAATGLGYSEANDIGGIASDALEAGKTGAVIGGVAPVAIKTAMGIPSAAKSGWKAFRNAVTNELDREAYRLGKEGVDIASPEFAQAHRAELTSESEKLAKSVEPVKTKAQAEIDKIQNKYQDQLDEYNKLVEEQKKLQEKFKEGQIKATDSALVDTNKKIERSAEKLQDDLRNIKDKIGQEYETIDKQSKATGIKINANNIIDDFVDKIKNSLDINETSKPKLIDELVKFKGNLNFEEFQSLKSKINNIGDRLPHQNKRFANDAYKNIGKLYEGRLRELGQNQLADKLTNANKQWSIYSDMDNYINGIMPNTKMDKVYSDTDTINTVLRLAKTEATDIGKLKPFRDYSERLGLDISEQEKLSSQLKQLKETKPVELEMPDLIKPEIDSEALELSRKNLSELQSYLGKGDKQSVDKARNLIIEASKLFGDPKREQELIKVKDILEQAYGKESADQIFQKMKTLSERERIGRIVNKDMETPLTKSGALREIIGGSKELKMRGAAKIGQGVKGITDMSKKLSEKTPESLKQLADTIGAIAKPGYQALSTILKQVAGSDKTAKQALLYSIMQNPGYRQIIQENDIDLNDLNKEE
jgi:Trp operon repressor